MVGIVKAVKDAVGGTLADQWQEVIEPHDMGATTVMTSGVKVRSKHARNSNVNGTDRTVTNGSVIHVYPNQFMMLVDGGRIVDYTAEEGYYVVNHSSQPSLFNGEFEGALADAFRRIRFGGVPSQAQRVYFINLQEIKGIKFGTRNPVNYFDNFYNAELFLRAHGSYSVKIVNPLTFFAEAVPRNADIVDFRDINQQYTAEFMTAFQSAINKMSLEGIRISHVTSKGMELAKYMSSVLDEDWTQMRGMQVQSIGIDSISYSEESQRLINRRNEGAMLQNPSVREGYVQGSIADSAKAAASNPNGAMHGFMGMNFGMNTLGDFLRGASESNRSHMQSPQVHVQRTFVTSSSTSSSSDFWTCACGEDNIGRFCTECGAGKPAPAAGDRWACGCGQENTGKFCTECGTKRPAAAQAYRCDKCGFESPSLGNSKFCPECGDPIDKNDVKA